MEKNEKTPVEQIKDILTISIIKFKNTPKTPELFDTNDYALKVHQKEVFLRVLRILNESGLK